MLIFPVLLDLCPVPVILAWVLYCFTPSPLPQYHMKSIYVYFLIFCVWMCVGMSMYVGVCDDFMCVYVCVYACVNAGKCVYRPMYKTSYFS